MTRPQTIEEAMAAANVRPPLDDPPEHEPITDPATGDEMHPSGADPAARREPTLAELGRRMFGR